MVLFSQLDTMTIALSAPIFLRLALYRWRRRVFDLEPMVDPARGAEKFRRNALAAECACMLEDDTAIAGEVPVESDSIASPRRRSHREPAFVDVAALLKALPAEITK